MDTTLIVLSHVSFMNREKLGFEEKMKQNRKKKARACSDVGNHITCMMDSAALQQKNRRLPSPLSLIGILGSRSKPGFTSLSILHKPCRRQSSVKTTYVFLFLAQSRLPRSLLRLHLGLPLCPGRQTRVVHVPCLLPYHSRLHPQCWRYAVAVAVAVEAEARPGFDSISWREYSNVGVVCRYHVSRIPSITFLLSHQKAPERDWAGFASASSRTPDGPSIFPNARNRKKVAVPPSMADAFLLLLLLPTTVELNSPIATLGRSISPLTQLGILPSRYPLPLHYSIDSSVHCTLYIVRSLQNITLLYILFLPSFPPSLPPSSTPSPIDPLIDWLFIQRPFVNPSIARSPSCHPPRYGPPSRSLIPPPSLSTFLPCYRPRLFSGPRPSSPLLSSPLPSSPFYFLFLFPPTKSHI